MEKGVLLLTPHTRAATVKHAFSELTNKPLYELTS